MRKKDIALIIAIVGGAALLSFLIFSVLFGNTTRATLSVEKVDEINADFNLPSEKYFNRDSLNPTQTITISPDGNQDPFSD